ncbi:MAG TPA: hypothetical protein ENJ37_03100 [Deltaproteobacteria bacterium]|nr:hypothetical protein [Deltaproteobacteria bacterium]
MASEREEKKRLLERLLDISAEQRRLLQENRLVDVLRRQEERDRLVARLKVLAPGGLGGDDALRALAGKVVEEDRSLGVSIRTSMDDIRRKLMRISGGVKAARAYGSR